MAGSGEALRYRNFALFWGGALISNTGSWVQNVTVPFVLYRLTGNALWVGLSTFAQFLPAVLLGPLAGSLADRYPRRRILLITQSALAVAALGLWGVWVADLAKPGVIVGLVCLAGIVAGLNITAWQAFVTELVPRSVLPNAITLNSAQFNASRALGPALGGVVLAAVGPGWAFLLNALSFGAVIAALVLIQVPRLVPPVGDRPTVMREFATTIRYVRDRPGLSVCILTVVVLGLLGSPVFSLIVVFTDDVFHVGRQAYGFLGACLGLGAIVGAPLVTGRVGRMARGAVVRVALPLYGASVAAFALAPVYAVAAVALVVAGAGYLAVAAALNTALQLQVDEARRGKVVALYLMALTAAIPVGGLVQGVLVDVFGPRTTVAAAGLLLVVLAVWLGMSGRLVALGDGPAAVAVAPASARSAAVAD